jgi:hypothetical protein
MRDAVSSLHRANLSIAVLLKQAARPQSSVAGACSADVIRSRMQAEMAPLCMRLPGERTIGAPHCVC